MGLWQGTRLVCMEVKQMSYLNPYSNYFPNYQTQPTQIQPQILNNQVDDRQWVSNQQGAEVYPMQPNSFMRLWDSSIPVFYEKRTDATGRPLPIVAYRYEEVSQKPEPEPLKPDAEQSLRDEIKAINERISVLEKAKKKEGKNES